MLICLNCGSKWENKQALQVHKASCDKAVKANTLYSFLNLDKYVFDKEENYE